MGNEAKIAQMSPYATEVEEGKTYYWYACGRSKGQPFCDGSHQGTEFSPLEFTADKDERYFFCACKQTGSPPMCDGSHKGITQEDLDAQDGLQTVWYKVAERDELRDGEVRAVQAGSQSIALTCHRGQIGALDSEGGPALDAPSVVPASDHVEEQLPVQVVRSIGGRTVDGRGEAAELGVAPEVVAERADHVHRRAQVDAGRVAQSGNQHKACDQTPRDRAQGVESIQPTDDARSRGV